MASTPDKFRVLHTGVGEAVAGDVITFPAGIDTDRLVALGAVEKLKGDEARQAEAYVESSQATQQTAAAAATPPPADDKTAIVTP